MTEKHSPLPWKVREDIGFFIQAAPEAGEKYGEAVVNNNGMSRARTVGRANAALIVRAVNGLPEAIAALEEIIRRCDCVLAEDIARAVLTKLKG